jgi:flavodoxin
MKTGGHMGRVLVVFFGISGTTEMMAQYIAEGLRITGHDAEVKKSAHIRQAMDLFGYDGYVFGSATYHLGIPEPFESFLAIASQSDLRGKVGGAFSSRAHPSGDEKSTAALIFDRMESGFGMRMTSLGPFDLKPDWLEGNKPALIDRPEGMHACHDYGRAIGGMLTNNQESL